MPKAVLRTNCCRNESTAQMPYVGVIRGLNRFAGAMNRVIYKNAAVGPAVARYFQRRHHQRVACMNLDRNHPALALRWRDLASTCAELDIHTELFTAAVAPEDVRGQMVACPAMVDQLLALPQRPTGIFVPRSTATGAICSRRR